MRILMATVILCLAASSVYAQGRRPRRGNGDDSGPKVGEKAPDITLKVIGKKENLSLKDMVKEGKKPVVLIFGSYTWPPFKRSAAALEKWYEENKKVASFYVVYIKEAHPSDSRRPIPGAPASPKSIDEREVLASDCIKEMKLTIPFLIDNMNDDANRKYSAWPDRIFIVDKEGTLAYKAGRGPRGFKPDEAKESLKKLLKNKGVHEK